MQAEVREALDRVEPVVDPSDDIHHGERDDPVEEALGGVLAGRGGGRGGEGRKGQAALRLASDGMGTHPPRPADVQDQDVRVGLGLLE